MALLDNLISLCHHRHLLDVIAFKDSGQDLCMALSSDSSNFSEHYFVLLISILELSSRWQETGTWDARYYHLL